MPFPQTQLKTTPLPRHSRAIVTETFSPVKQAKKRIKTSQCLKSSPLIDAPHNERIIQELQKLLDRYLAEGDKWRVVSYRKAINSIKGYPKELSCGKEAAKLPGVGQKIADKVNQLGSRSFIYESILIIPRCKRFLILEN